MELFCENSQRVLVFKHFLKNVHRRCLMIQVCEQSFIFTKSIDHNISENLRTFRNCTHSIFITFNHFRAQCSHLLQSFPVFRSINTFMTEDPIT